MFAEFGSWILECYLYVLCDTYEKESSTNPQVLWATKIRPKIRYFVVMKIENVKKISENIDPKVQWNIRSYFWGSQ